MPALVLFGRRWHLASDDLPLPSSLGILWHATYLFPILVSLSFTVRQLPDACFYRRSYIGYLSTHTGLFTCQLILHAWLLVESSRGSLYQVHLRKRVPYLVVACILGYALTLGNNAYGTHLVREVTYAEACRSKAGTITVNHVLLFRWVVNFSWAALAIGTLLFFLTFNLFPTLRKSQEPANRAAVRDSWARRCGCYQWLLCTCLRRARAPLTELRGHGDSESPAHDVFAQSRDGSGHGPSPRAAGHVSFTEQLMPQDATPLQIVARIFHAVFGNVDMTLSDYMACVMLVGVKHRLTRPAYRYATVTGPHWLKPQHHSTPWGTVVGNRASDATDPAAGRGVAIAEPLPPPSPPLAQAQASAPSAAAEPAALSSAALGQGWEGAGPAAAAAAADLCAPPASASSFCSARSHLTTSSASHSSLVSMDSLKLGLVLQQGSEQQPPPSHQPDNAPSSTAAAAGAGAGAGDRGAAAATSPGARPKPPAIIIEADAISAAEAESEDGVDAGPSQAAPGAATDAGMEASAGDYVAEGPSGEVPPPPPCADGCTYHPSDDGKQRHHHGHHKAFNSSGSGTSKPGKDCSRLHAPLPHVDVAVLEESVHYKRFAAAAYGWKMYLYYFRSRAHHCCRLCFGRGCGCCRQHGQFFRGGEAEASCYSPTKILEREAITQMAGVPDEDVLYVSYEVQVQGLLPYFIALDRIRQAVVVSVRGSLSLSDVITDLVGEAVPLTVRHTGWVQSPAQTGAEARDVSSEAAPSAGAAEATPTQPSSSPSPITSPQGQEEVLGYAHMGMYDCAIAILQDIQKQGILESLFMPPESGLVAATPKRVQSIAAQVRGECVGWRLVLTGHSLGAGVSALLGLMLRRRFPHLRCWSFAPPGGLMSKEAAELTRPFTISVVHAKDMIPRLSLGNMEGLVEAMVKAGTHARLSKIDLMLRLWLLRHKPGEDALFSDYEQLSQDQRQALFHYQVATKESMRVKSPIHNARTFQPPGHILYYERHKAPGVHDPCCCNPCMSGTPLEKTAYSTRWISAEELIVNGLVISRSMFLDHIPDNTYRAMLKALEEAKLAAAFSPGQNLSAKPRRFSIGQAVTRTPRAHAVPPNTPAAAYGSRAQVQAPMVVVAVRPEPAGASLQGARQ